MVFSVSNTTFPSEETTRLAISLVALSKMSLIVLLNAKGLYERTSKYIKPPAEILISKTFKAEIIKKFKVTQREASDLFARIQNYQIKKYGKRLDFNESMHTKETAKHVQLVARTRKYQSYTGKSALAEETY